MLEHFPFAAAHFKCSSSLFAERIHAPERFRSFAIRSNAKETPPAPTR